MEENEQFSKPNQHWSQIGSLFGQLYYLQLHHQADTYHLLVGKQEVIILLKEESWPIIP